MHTGHWGTLSHTEKCSFTTSLLSTTLTLDCRVCFTASRPKTGNSKNSPTLRSARVTYEERNGLGIVMTQRWTNWIHLYPPFATVYTSSLGLSDEDFATEIGFLNFVYGARIPPFHFLILACEGFAPSTPSLSASPGRLLPSTLCVCVSSD